MKRPVVRVAGTLVVTALAVAYLLWRIDLGETLDTLKAASLPWFLVACAIMLVTVVPMAWRWQRLLDAQGVHERLAWLTRAYLVSYTAGQVLPTSIGGDAMRIFETSRRHSRQGSVAAATVLLERALGGAATLTLAAVGLVLAAGRYDVGPYLWIELAFVVGTVLLGVLLFAPGARPLLARSAPLLRRVRLERPVRAVYEAIHSYRSSPRLLLGVFALTLALQSVRVLAIWATAEAVGVDVSVRVFYVMGPLFFLLLLVPFTLNGLAVREAFFVSFLGRVGVDPDAAFSAGFLFFVITLVLSAPGLVILVVEGVRGGRARAEPSVASRAALGLPADPDHRKG